ncbi:MAG: condensation domain-containing protein, partial [Xenophilus sp.]
MSAVMQPALADDFDPFSGGRVERAVPTTEAQRELWLGDRLGREASLAYNEAVQLRLRGRLDAQALASALDDLVARHESLRATLSPDGMQLLIGEALPVAPAFHDLSAMDEPARRQRLEDAREAAVLTPFVLEHGPLFRAELLRLAPDDHLLLMSAHHAVCDGWSWSVITRDLAALYGHRSGAAPAPQEAERYSDYAAWEAAEAQQPGMQAHVDYWLSHFKGSLPVLELPLDHPRPAVRTFRSQRVDQDLDAALAGALRKLGAQAGTSLTAVLFGGFAGLLHRLTAQEDLVIGIAAAGQLASGMHSLVGHCVNLLPLRVAVDARQPFAELVKRSGSTLLDAFEHQTLTFGALLKKLPVGRDPSRLPLVSVLFNVDPDLSAGASRFPGLQAEQWTVPRRFENFELFLNIVATRGGGMRMEAQYNADLYDDASIRRWLGMYETLLRSAAQEASQPLGRLALLSPAEARAVRGLQPA